MAFFLAPGLLVTIPNGASLMLKITTIAQSDKETTFRLEGRIVREWVPELRAECQKHLEAGRLVILDLSGVAFVDNQGIESITALKEGGVRLSNCSLFLSALLGEG